MSGLRTGAAIVLLQQKHVPEGRPGSQHPAKELDRARSRRAEVDDPRCERKCHPALSTGVAARRRSHSLLQLPLGLKPVIKLASRCTATRKIELVRPHTHVFLS